MAGIDGTRVGLSLNFIGALLLGVTAQFGTVAVLDGGIVLKGCWWWLNLLGWLLLGSGFVVQLAVAGKLPPRDERPSPPEPHKHLKAQDTRHGCDRPL